ncbi:flagellar basal body-associated FliL family protein [Vibrio sp. PNB22_3_1]
MKIKVLIIVGLLVVMAAGGAFAYKKYHPSDPAPVVVVPDEELVLKKVLVQFEASGKDKLLMVDVSLFHKPEHADEMTRSMSRMRNELILHLVVHLPELYGTSTFEHSLQAEIHDYLSSHQSFKITDVLITRIVVQ